MKNEHTSGPWSIWEDWNDKTPCFSIRGANPNRIICKTIENEGEPPASKISESNAKLIAAAPELAEIAQNYLAALEIIKRNRLYFIRRQKEKKPPKH